MKWFIIALFPLFLNPSNPPEIIYTATTSQIPTVTAKRLKFEDVDLLARLIASEAALEPYEGKLAVGQVVLNRMADKRQSMIEVIYAKGQFDGVRTKYFRRVPPKDCLRAAKDVLLGKRIIPSTVLYYHNSRIATDKKWIRYIEQWKYSTIGLHTFCHTPQA